MMKLKSIRIKIKNGISSILVAEALIICIISLISINVFYRVYTEMLYNESAEVLNLFFTRVEDRLREIEKLSFSILSDVNIQNNIAVINDDPNSYAGYFSQQEARNQLLLKMFSVDNVFSIDFITNNDQQLNVGYSSTAHNNDNLELIKEIAYEGNGSNRWAVNLSMDNTVSSVRLIKDIRKASFEPLGILVINVNLNDLMTYKSVVTNQYNPDILVLSDEQIIYSNTHNLKYMESNNIAFSYPKDKPYYIEKINGENYFISGMQSDYIDWTFLNVLRCEDILTRISSLNKLIIIIYIIATGLSLVIGLRFSSVISNSVVALSSRMKEVTKGNYDEEIKEEETLVKIDEVMSLYGDFNIMIKRINYLINDVYKKEIMIRETRYKVLQQQINPHFLYNTLDTINWMAQGNKKVTVMVQSLSNMLRSSVGQDDVVKLSKEIAFLNDYIVIQKIRFEERLDFSLNIDRSFNDLLIPKITLQPIVENSINYSLERYSNVCVIVVEARRYEEYSEITVSDNGPGMEEGFIEKLLAGQIRPTKSGIGLKNIDQRLKLMNGEKYGLDIKSTIGFGTKVTVRLPNRIEYLQNKTQY